MDPQQTVKISKYLSKHLRHQPERLGLELQPGGWVEVAALLAACARARFPVSESALREVVANCEKQRFAFDETGTKIRANQGHSVEVDLELPPQEPPPVLYHGTVEKFWSSIQEQGLLKMARQHVHLSVDLETARKVGGRRGRPLILCVAAAQMQAEGHTFYRSENGVWLVDHVPPRFVAIHEAN